MNDLKKILKKLEPAINFARRYMRFIFLIFLILLCSFLVYQINHFISVTPSDDEVSAKLQTITRPHIDQSAIFKIQELRDQNVQVQSLFDHARDNPFSE